MAARLFRLRAIAAAGLMAGLLLSPKLWVSTRFYPLTPVAPFLKALPYPFDYAIYILLLALLGVTVVARDAWRPRLWIAASVALLAALWTQDQSRLQPWCYQYAFMLMGCACVSAEAALNVCRLIIAAIYFWSGAQKLNPYFATETFAWLAHPVAAQYRTLVICGGYVAPWVEMACAIGLLTRKGRKPAIAALIAMHAGILLAIGPLGHDFNTVVWPWNIAMAAFLLLLFWRTEARASEIVWGRAGFHRLVFALFCVAPALSFFNLWDSYLSAALYSGNKNQGAIYMTEAVAEHLPDAVYDDVSEEANGRDKLLVNDWSFDELNAPAYAEMRVFKSAARRLCGFAAQASDVRLEVTGKAALANGLGKRVFICSDL
jgi:uncharacterized membrane protein YphA (DoxX/SURF4 family)